MFKVLALHAKHCCFLKYFNGVYEKIDETHEGRP